MRRTTMLIRSMDGPIRVLSHLLQDLRIELDKTGRDLQEEFPITETGIKEMSHAETRWPRRKA